MKIIRKVLFTLCAILLTFSLNNKPVATQSSVLQPGDFTYLNCYYDVQIGGQDFTYSQGFAGHYVGGQLRFLTQGLHNVLQEWTIGSHACGDDITSADQTHQWDLQSTGRDILSPWMGLWVNPADDKLWIAGGAEYTTTEYPAAIVTMTLNSNNTISNVHIVNLEIGPTHVNSKRMYGGFAAVPASVQSTYGFPPYVGGFGGYTSLVAQGGGASMGSTMYAFPNPAGTADDGTIPLGTYKIVADHAGASGTNDWYTTGVTPPPFDRGSTLNIPINYFDGGDPRMNPPTPPTDPPVSTAGWLSPSPDGKGRMVWGDSYYNTGMWISGQRSGFVQIASLCYGKCYYISSTIGSDDITWELHIFSEADLGAALSGSKNPWNVQPSGYKSLIGLPNGPATGHGRWGNTPVYGASGAYYDPATHRMYILSYGSGRDVYHGRLYVFDVNTGGSPPPADTTPPTVSVSAPGAGTVSGVVTVSANASDAGSGVAGVQFLLDGNPLGTEDTSSPYSISWDTGSASNGSHTLKAAARDFASNTATSAGVAVTVSNNADTTAPAVSVTAPSGTISGTVSVTATATDAVGVVGVQFKLNGINLGNEDTSSPYAVSWNTTGAANGSYTLTAIARDAAGNIGTSADHVVTVNNVVPDTTPPSVTETNTPGTVSGNLTLTATASDNIAVVGVQFKVDGGQIGAEDTTGPYSLVWDTTSVQNGSHTLSATARDAAGNSTTSATVSITVSNSPPPPPPPTDTTPPTVTITAPLNGATISTTGVAFTANASDNVAVASVQFKDNGVNIGSADTTAPYGVTWDTTSVNQGAHVLSVVATDTANLTTTASINVLVAIQPPPPPPDATPPVVAFTSPIANATVSGSISLTATASDNIAVTSVQFFLNGNALFNPITSSPYTHAWDTTTVTNGPYTLLVKALDGSGNIGTASETITVGNPDTTPPTVSITSPTDGATVVGVIPINATATDDRAMAYVKFLIDGVLLSTDTSPSYSASWDTGVSGTGLHIVQAIAADTFGNTATASITVSVTANTCQTNPLVVTVSKWPKNKKGANSLSWTSGQFTIVSHTLLWGPERAVFVDDRGCTTTVYR